MVEFIHVKYVFTCPKCAKVTNIYATFCHYCDVYFIECCNKLHDLDGSKYTEIEIMDKPLEVE